MHIWGCGDPQFRPPYGLGTPGILCWCIVCGHHTQHNTCTLSKYKSRNIFIVYSITICKIVSFMSKILCAILASTLLRAWCPSASDFIMPLCWTTFGHFSCFVYIKNVVDRRVSSLQRPPCCIMHNDIVSLRNWCKENSNLTLLKQSQCSHCLVQSRLVSTHSDNNFHYELSMSRILLGVVSHAGVLFTSPCNIAIHGSQEETVCDLLHCMWTVPKCKLLIPTTYTRQ